MYVLPVVYTYIMFFHYFDASSFSSLDNREEKYPDSIAMTVLDHKVITHCRKHILQHFCVSNTAMHHSIISDLLLIIVLLVIITHFRVQLLLLEQ